MAENEIFNDDELQEPSGDGLIIEEGEDLELFLKKNKDKKCRQMSPVFSVEEYKEYPHTQVRKLTSDEIKKYMSER